MPFIPPRTAYMNTIAIPTITPVLISTSKNLENTIPTSHLTCNMNETKIRQTTATTRATLE